MPFTSAPSASICRFAQRARPLRLRFADLGGSPPAMAPCAQWRYAALV